MRVLLFTGKGGVGKTTTAAATAVHAARLGTKTLVLSTDPAHSLGDALDVRLTAEPVEVEPGLTAQQVAPRARLERSWQRLHEYLLDLLEALGADPLTAHELTAVPGADEVLALLELRDQVQQGPWDLVVVDCASTAETLRLLALPEALGWHLDQALRPERLVARARSPVVRRAGRLPLPQDRVLDAVRALRGELADVRCVLTADAASVRLVLTPDRVVLAEARRALTSLALHGYRVDGVVANRVIPGGDDAWRAGWARAQGEVLREARASFASLPLLESPYLDDEPVGLDALAELGDRLYRSGAGGHVDPLASGDGEPPLRLERSGDEFVLDLAVPLADRRDVDLVRRGDDVVLSVGSTRRILSLPSALRRCQVAGAALRGGRLRIRFEPDPALWRSL
ncbi:MAG: ArsA family ATPase [Actinomycetes bacterium]